MLSIEGFFHLVVNCLCTKLDLENSLAAMMIAKTSAGVKPEVNLRGFVTYTPLLSMNKAAHSVFETQTRHHQKTKTGLSLAPQKDIWPLIFFLKTFKMFKKMYWIGDAFSKPISTKAIFTNTSAPTVNLYCQVSPH